MHQHALTNDAQKRTDAPLTRRSHPLPWSSRAKTTAPTHERGVGWDEKRLMRRKDRKRGLPQRSM